MRVYNFTANWNNWDITFSFVLEIMSKLEMCRYGQLVIKFLRVILNIQQDISFRVWAHNNLYGPQLVLSKICKLKIKMPFRKTCQQRAGGKWLSGLWDHRSFFFLSCCFEMFLIRFYIFQRNTFVTRKSYYSSHKRKKTTGFKPPYLGAFIFPDYWPQGSGLCSQPPDQS